MRNMQQYSTIVVKNTGLDLLKEARDNEQAIQPFTQTPSVGQPGADEKAGLHPHELFFMFTAEIIKKKTVFTR